MTTLPTLPPPPKPPRVATWSPDNDDDGLFRIKMELRKLTARQVVELQDYLASKGIDTTWERK